MRVRLLIWAALAAITSSCGGTMPTVPVTPLPPPVVPPPVIPPITPPPAQPPPASIVAVLDRIPLGATQTAVTSAVGVNPVGVPQSPNAPIVLRYDITDAAGLRFVVFVVFESGLSVRKGFSRVEDVR